MADLSIGAVFAGHRIEGIAGRGGMGTVYRATHIALDHLVALKVIAIDLADDGSFRERFKSESRIAVSLRHPNVVPIHHAGEEDGLLFVTMDLIDGPDLRKLLIARGPLPADAAVAVIEQVASALDVAHSRGLVHRDIKPGNVLIEEGGGERGGDHAYLTDFGLTKRIDQASEATALTSTGAFVGTLDYVAPEQIRGDPLDARTDVYALGCVLFEILAGRPPFSSRAEKVAKMYRHLQDAPGTVGGDGAVLDPVIERAMAKQPEDRFPSAGDLARAAAATLAGRSIETAERNVGTGMAAPTEQHQPPPALTDQPPAAETVASAPPPDRTLVSESGPPSAGNGTRLDEAGQRRTGREQVTQATSEGAPRAARDPAAPPAARRSRLLLLAALAAVAALVVVAVVALSGGRSDDEPAGSGDAAQPEVAGGSIPGGELPVGVAAAGEDVFIADRDGGRLIRADAASMKDTGRYRTGGQPEDVVVAGDQAFVTVPGADQVQVLNRDPDSSADPFVIKLPTGSKPMGITPGEGYVWVAGSGSGSVYRIDPADPTAYESFDLGAELPFGIAVDGDVLWVVDREGGEVIRFDTGSGDRKQIVVGANPKGIALADGFAYVANTDDGTVSVIDIDRAEVTATVDVGGQPRAVDVLDGRVWVSNGDTEANVEADGGNGWVDYFDAGTQEHAGKVTVGGSPEGIGVDAERVWVATGSGGVVKAIAP